MRLERFLLPSLLLLIAPPAASAASLALTPEQVDFSVQRVNTESQPATVTLSNETDQTIQLNEIIPSGIDFSTTHDCQARLPPKSQCSIQIRFKPLIPGERIGIVEVVASDGYPYLVRLSGKGQ
ncbi:MAG: choice-of-anchor D domain-containing protein [Acidobacteria bacterium]|nr:choice-of-anchor D domain-containing protein [Acidobacteriota bacterium]